MGSLVSAGLFLDIVPSLGLLVRVLACRLLLKQNEEECKMGNWLYFFGALVLIASPVFALLFIKSSWANAVVVIMGLLVGLGACIKGLSLNKKL